ADDFPDPRGPPRPGEASRRITPHPTGRRPGAGCPCAGRRGPHLPGGEMAERQAIAFGASAGGLEALLKIVKDLPAGLPAPAFVVVHCPPNSPSVLPEILTRSGPLPATHPQDGEEVRPGRIYVAPPNFHLALDGGRARVWFGPRVNGFRPAIDLLLRSAAE